MSIGDSVLDYMNKDEVKSKMRYGFESKEYAYVEIKKKSERYDIRGFLDRSNIDEDDYIRLKSQGMPHHQIMQEVKRL